MRLCNETVTIINKKWDSSEGKDIYNFSVVRGVSWYSDIASAVDSTGLHAANRIIVRIPADADFGGKQYVDTVTYASETIVSGLFTLAQGDVIVKAEVTDTSLKPAQIHDLYPDCMTVLGVTDNRRAPNAKHWKVVGQ